MPGGRTTLCSVVTTGDGMGMVPSKSTCDETAHIYIGEALTPAGAIPGDTESLPRWVFSFDEAQRLVPRDEIMDSTSLVGLALAAQRPSPPR